ncbi:KaiC [Rubidibacter lacunae KORDI 51-2]|uniref:KaiC n=1 Tax=Rubidibacter lacunae KORDI 51-2 TaxID=582515 RepID=U5DNQ8_9CHRO|nr:ATP-binding protein [Rubidibacter lacunae]ERN41340.1 KaiC [Rubidibacter lacunae KORDI 51-2]
MAKHRIERNLRRLADGSWRVYRYLIGSDGSRRSLGAVESTVSQTSYRETEKRRIVAALQARSGVLVVGETGSGKTTLARFVAADLELLGYPIACVSPSSPKQTLVKLAEALGVPTESLTTGKALNGPQLQAAIAEFLQSSIAFLVVDDAERLGRELRGWLAGMLSWQQPMLLLATLPPRKDLFLRLPRIELDALPNAAMRAIARDAAAELGIELSAADLASLLERCGGNPMLVQREVRSEFLGLKATAPDHTQWVDATPFLVAGLMVFTVMRFIGLGFNSTSLYLLGGILTVAVGVVRVVISSLPRQPQKLGA